MRAGAVALLLFGCSQGAPTPPAPAAQAAVHDCAACGKNLQIVNQPITTMKKNRLITPELDATELARRLGRPDLEPTIAELIVTVQTRILSAKTDLQASTALDDFIASLNQLARPTL